jgi:tyrosyl-tRNA synthetase
MNFLEELKWRRMLHNATPGTEKLFENPPVTGYIGFDPTAPSMTLGNYVQIMLLTLFQRSGNKPIALMGGATGQIGDPSGKESERTLKTLEELEHNLNCQKAQLQKMLDFSPGPLQAEIINNFDFYKDMNVLSYLRDVGKHFSINYMLAKDSVKTRLESGISYTEFSYQVLQGYDFCHLYKNHGVNLQMGGSDQWGNMTAGAEYIRKTIGDAEVHAVTTPLLTRADGKKFGKSEEGNIWLDAELTSPYKFYQFWVNSDDKDLPNLLRYFTLKSQSETEELENEMSDDPKGIKEVLATEVTERIHGANALHSAREVSQLIFNKKANNEWLKTLDQATFEMIGKEIPLFEIEKSSIRDSLILDSFLTEQTGSMASKGDVRRSIKNNALSINKIKATSHDQTIDMSAFLHDSYLLIENGKKNKFLVKLI